MGFGILYSITDSKGADSTTVVNVPTGISLQDVTAFARQMAVAINNCITGQITRIGVTLSVDLPATVRVAPIAGSDVEEGARFQFRTGGGFYTSLRLPTFNEDYVQDNSTAVDLTETPVLTFVTAMTEGIDTSGGFGEGVGLVEPSDAREEDIVSLSAAKESFQSSRN